MYITSGKIEDGVLTKPEPVSLVLTQHHRILGQTVSTEWKHNNYIHTSYHVTHFVHEIYVHVPLGSQLYVS